MLTVKQTWTIANSAAGSSGGLTAIELLDSPAYAVMYVDHSTIATTNSVSFQSAQNSTGPWLTEGSTQLATGNVSTAFAMRVTGPIGPFVRPFFGTASTGAYNVLLLGVI